MGSLQHKPGRAGSPVKATLTGIADQLRSRPRVGTLAPTARLDGRSCLITGAASGLGKATAVGLARLGASVMMPTRRHDDEAVREVRAASGSEAVETEYLDLANLESVKRFCRRMHGQGRAFDVVVLNAGVVTRRSRRTSQGFDETFAVNYLANYVLVRELLDSGVIPNRTFADCPRGATPRLVFVSSEEHRSAEPYDWSGFGRYREYGISGSLTAYAESKYLCTVFAYELARRLGDDGAVDVSVHALCPGAVNTNIAREAPRWSQPLLKAVFSLFFKSPERAAEPAIYLSCEPTIEGETAIYLHMMTRKQAASSAMDRATGQRLWAETERLLDLPPDRQIDPPIRAASTTNH